MFASKWRFLQILHRNPTIGSKRNCAQSLANDDLINVVVVTPKVKSSLFASIRVVGFMEELKDEYIKYSQPTPNTPTAVSPKT
jgi:hypothetical protein